jgi:hypothetical protein
MVGLISLWSKLVFSGRELFLSDASLFIDDIEAYENYDRQEREQANEQEVTILSFCCLSNAWLLS